MANPIERDLIVRHVRAATHEVFETMLGMEIHEGDPYVQPKVLGAAGGVMSLIGLAGTWTGAGSILCSPLFACRISGHLMMAEYADVNDEVLDAMAEVTNMIIGNFKSLLEPHLGPLGLSIPSVIYGRNFTARTTGEGEWTVIPFTCGEDTLEIRVYLTPAREPTGKTAVVAEAEEMLASRP